MYDDLQNEFISLAMLAKRFVKLMPKYSDLTMVEQFVMNQIYLLRIKRSDAEINVSEIAEQINVTKGALSQVLNSLEKKNYITRSISLKDRRAVALGLTDTGKQVLERHCCQMNGFIKELVEKMGDDNVKKMVELIKEMTDIIDSMSHEEKKTV